MDRLYEIVLALIMIVAGAIPIESYRQTDPKKKNSALRFLVVGISLVLAGVIYLIAILNGIE